MSWIIKPSYAPQFPNNPTNGLLWLDTNTGIVWQFSSGTSTWSVNDFYTKAGALPSLDLRFAENKSLVDYITGQQLVTFARSSPGGTFVDSAGVLQTAVTNLLLRSEELDSSVWTKVGGTISVNSIASPSGAITADTLVEDTSTGTHRCVNSVAIANTTIYTVSAYAKAVGRTHVRLSLGSGLAGELTANLSNGTVAASSGATNPTVQSVGNDWYRISFTSASSSGTTGQVQLQLIQGTNTPSYTGDGASGAYFWGAQLEQASTVGEYVPTTSTINSAPRFDHRITSSTTNLLPRSEEFDNAGTWGVLNVTVAANTQVAPNGTTSAETLTDVNGVTSANVGCFQSTTLADSTTYAMSCYVKAGTKTTCRVGIRAKDGVNIFANFNLSAVSTTAGNALSSTIQDAGNGWYRCTAICASATGATSPRGLVFMDTGIYTSNGTGTIHVWGAQLEQSATVGPYVPTTTAAATSNTTESLGLLVEEARTNSIRNNTMVGAVAGTPGTLPTNWVATTSGSGVTREIVGTGTENGIAYVDIRYAGTTTASLTFTVTCEPNTFVVAANGQSWTYSAYVKIVAGSFSGFNAPQIIIDEYSSGGAFLAGQTTSVPAFTSTLTRITATRTNTNASTAFLQAGVRYYASSGNTIDMTLRIGLPQLEQGAFATSPIPTTTAAATRAADLVDITGSAFSSWFRQDEGTMFVDGSTPAFTGTTGFVGINPVASNNRLEIRQGRTSPTVTGASTSVIWTSIIANPTLVANTSYKQAVAFSSASHGNSIAGALDTSSTVIPVIAATRLMFGVRDGQTAPTAGSSSTIRRFTFWPQRLPNPTLQSLTQ